MPQLPDFGPLAWNLAFEMARARGATVGEAWAEADEAWTRLKEGSGRPVKEPGRPHPNVKRRKK